MKNDTGNILEEWKCLILICADGYIFDHVCKKAHQIILFKYEPFIICQLYLNLFFFFF